MPIAPTPGMKWTRDYLQSLRTVGDPLADAVITGLFAGGGIAAMNNLMRSFVANEHPAPESLDPAVRAYFEQSSVLPAWANPDQIAAGEELFWRFGPDLILILTCYALPFCYLGRNGVPVLALTNRLISNPTRRIVETAQMLVDVMKKGGITTAAGRGRLTLQKVRLMHAAIRKLAPAAPGWKSEYGLPVNQEDLAGTLMSFSWVSLDGLQKLGIDLTDADREAYVHCWNVIGYLLGVHEDLLPASAADGKALAAAIAAHEFGPSPEGKELTAALVGMLKHILPGDVFDHAPEIMIRYFLGKQEAAWLGVGDSLLARLSAAPLRLLGFVAGDAIEDSKAISALAGQVGHLLIQSLVYCERGGNRPSFSIPSELKQQWGVNWT